VAAFPNLGLSDEDLLRLVVREEVAKGIAQVRCTSGCVRMKGVMWGMGVMYLSLIGLVLGKVIG
jgi:hypothetical protein